ncbi:MAG: 5-(carboxyamino)imidazole ribonucleotide mutase [Termitinemataceae bacterium]|nr:MAG: 5-(carboxyamino)imidazole ribonucleotide mutase [Termitinemataceae bacterium]
MKIGIILGSTSDTPVAEKAFEVLKSLQIPFEAHCYSAHRTPFEAAEFSKNAKKNGFGVIIAFAGMAAHLAGALAAHTTLPVIGVPCKGGAQDGMDALLSTVQMPSGVPVAAVAINGGANAALLAAQILSISDEKLSLALQDRKLKMQQDILKQDSEFSKKYFFAP